MKTGFFKDPWINKLPLVWGWGLGWSWGRGAKKKYMRIYIYIQDYILTSLAALGAASLNLVGF